MVTKSSRTATLIPRQQSTVCWCIISKFSCTATVCFLIAALLDGSSCLKDRVGRFPQSLCAKSRSRYHAQAFSVRLCRTAVAVFACAAEPPLHLPLRFQRAQRPVGTKDRDLVPRGTFRPIPGRENRLGHRRSAADNQPRYEIRQHHLSLRRTQSREGRVHLRRAIRRRPPRAHWIAPRWPASATRQGFSEGGERIPLA